MEISNTITFLSIARIMLSGFVFLLYGLTSREKVAVESFLLSNKSLKRR